MNHVSGTKSPNSRPESPRVQSWARAQIRNKVKVKKVDYKLNDYRYDDTMVIDAEGRGIDSDDDELYD